MSWWIPSPLSVPQHPAHSSFSPCWPCSLEPLAALPLASSSASSSSLSSSCFPSIHPAFPPLQWPRQWDPGCSQPRGPSSRLSLFTAKPKGSRVNPTTWHGNMPAKGMPMSASIAALFICSLLFLFYSVCLCMFLSPALSLRFLAISIFCSFSLSLSLHTVEC